jgi:hypothetical protein
VTNPGYIIGFLSQWKVYLDQIPAGPEAQRFRGKKLDPTIFEKVRHRVALHPSLHLDRSLRVASLFSFPRNSWVRYMSLCRLQRTFGSQYNHILTKIPVVRPFTWRKTRFPPLARDKGLVGELSPLKYGNQRRPQVHITCDNLYLMRYRVGWEYIYLSFISELPRTTMAYNADAVS